MRKGYIRKHCFAAFVACGLVVGTLSGCGKETSGTDTVEQVEEVEQNEESQSIGGTGLLASVKSTYDSVGLDEDYNKGQYYLPEDYVFEFPCSDEAGSRSFEAFEVYATPDYSGSFRAYNKNTYEDGMIKVEPGDIVQLSKNGSKDVHDGTWGALNQLYLIQKIDLETGEDLAKPIVTPFSVEHEMNAPVVKQSVDEKNNYTLSWKPIEGAKEYVVYEYFGGCAYNVCCTTKETSVNVEEFKKQKESEELIDLFKQDLEKEGMEVDREGIAYMNSALKYDEEMQDGYYAVVAIDKDGKSSGLSNIVDVRDVAHLLPYQVAEAVLEMNISQIYDVPTYVNVKMLDGSVAQMIIDYHGAQAYKYPDDPEKIGIRAHVANTMFDNSFIVLHGMKYEDVVKDIQIVLDREDELLTTVRPAEVEVDTIEVTRDPVEEEPDEEITEEITEEVKTEEVTEEVTEEATTEEITEEVTEEMTTEEVTEEITEEVTMEEITEEVTEEVTTEEATTEHQSVSIDSPKTESEKKMAEVETEVTATLEDLGMERVNSVLFAKSDLEAWIAYCLIAQSDEIPVPSTVFPEAANMDYLVSIFLEAYRQNPTSGVINISNVKYDTRTECLTIPYCEDSNVRLKKTKEELSKAEEVVASVCRGLNSDYDKVFALNEYFRENASYDQDSMSTNVDMNSLSEAFIDAHTPYGILCKNYGVCESYSEAFMLTSRMAGLESIAEIGTLFGGGHEWNRVKIDGNWCVLDITNNDNDTFVNGLMNLSEEQMAGILVPSVQAIANPEEFAATTSVQEYYYVNKMSADSLEEAKEILRERLKNDSSATVRLPLGTSESDANTLMKELAKEGTGITKGGTCFGLLRVEK